MLRRFVVVLGLAVVAAAVTYGEFWRDVARRQLTAFTVARVEDVLARATVLDSQGRECEPCPGDRSGRLLCCAKYISLDDASLALLNQAFNFSGQLGEHDRLLQEAARRFGVYDAALFDASDRVRACQRRAVELETRIARLERRRR